MLELAIVGAAGRMGRRLVALAEADAALRVRSAVDAAGPDHDTLTGRYGCVIDFSTPAGTRQALAFCADSGSPLVIGTTGLTAEEEARIDRAARRIPVMQATNFSQVVNVLNHLAAEAVKLLGDDYDLEILEAHHRYKKDAPSGTALTLARVAAEAAGRDFDTHVKLARHGEDAARQPEDITVQALRIGDHPGEHTLYLAAPGERLELRHVSTSRDSYAAGALRAAKWLQGKPAGRYTMADVLGLD